MKRLRILALVMVCMVLGSLVPAVALGEEDGVVTITFMDWDSSVGSREIEWKTFFETFPEYKDKVKIEIVSGGSGEINVLETMRKLLASGQLDEMPDIVTCNWAGVPEYYNMGIIHDVSAVYDQIGDTIYDRVVNLMQYKGQYMGFPVELKTKIWTYRKDMFEAAGVNPADIKTVDDFIAAGEKIREVYPNSYIENYTAVPQAYDLYMYLSGNGGSLADEDGNYVVANNPAVREGFEYLSKLMASGVVNTEIQDFSSDWYAALNDGTICSQLLAGWFPANHLPRNCPDMSGLWGMALWPESISEGSENGAKLMMVVESSPHKELVMELLTKFCYSKENATAMYNSVRATVPYLKECAEDPTFLTDGTYLVHDRMKTEFAAIERMKVYPYTPNGSLEQTIIAQYLGEYLSGTMDLDTALQAAEDDLKLQIGNAYN